MSISTKKLIGGICKNLGYRNRYGCYVKPISQDIHATISFNVAHYGVKGHSFIAPRIGVLHDRVEELLYKVSNMECYKRPDFPTISEHIGYVLSSKGWIEWDFNEEGNDLAIKAMDMQDKIQQSAAIFSSKYSNLNDIITYIEGLPYGSSYQELLIRLPIMYYLVGEKDKGLLFITSICKGHPENIIFSTTFRTNFSSLP